MYWVKKYNDAIVQGKQLIGDKVMREILRSTYSHVPILEEVRFPEFTADMLIIYPKYPAIVGVEVKSDRDNLLRLPQQLDGYLKYCNKVFVATTFMHRKDILEILAYEKYQDVGLCFYVMENGEKFFWFEKFPLGSDIRRGNANWISKKHQLYQWKYILEMIWKEE